MSGAALILAGAAAMLAAPAPAPNYEAEIGRAIFELCPKVVDGTLALDDPTSLAAIGYGATAPRQVKDGTNPRATRGSGAEAIVISGRRKADGGSCGVWFGGQNSKRLFKAIRKKAEKSGFGGSGTPARLGDGTEIYSYRARGSERRSLIFISGAAGDGIGPYPTTSVMMMDTKGE